MKRLFKLRLSALTIAAAMSASAVWATDGYFPIGYGMAAQGMGGAAVAMTDDAFTGANNPAASAWTGSRAVGGLTLFSPNRAMSRTGSAVGMNDNVSSDSNMFYIPEFAYNKMVSSQVGYGISVYGNGGMNTDYAGGQTNCSALGGSAASNPLCGSGRLGVNLEQLTIAPSFGYKFTPDQSVGISLLYVVQKFSANGLQLFQGLSGASKQVTNNGADTSRGLGLRLGYLGNLNNQLTLGASFSPKTTMSKFTQYAGLFADGGNFDIPQNAVVGLAYKASPSVLFALDLERINYASVPSIGNASSNQSPLGSANGPGFGWSNVNVMKLGMQWQATPSFLLRTGYNRSTNPVSASNVSFNIVAPGVSTTHYTVGGTFVLSPTTDITFAYMYSPQNSVTGGSLFGSFGAPLAATETVQMSQQSLGVQVGWKF